MFKRIRPAKRKDKYGWSGDYKSWDNVSAESAGCDKQIILDKTNVALLKVKSGAAAYERNSVTFDKKEIPYALLSFLMLSVSLKKEPLNILGFGGTLGSTYYQLKDFLTADICGSCNIIEQKHYVDCGKANFEDETLKFYSSIDNCIAEKQIDFILLSGSVQYLKEPHVFLKKLVLFDFDFILFDRTAFNNTANDRLCLQVVPPEIYPASYPAWFFDQDFFLSHFSKRYKVVAEFPSYVEKEAVMFRNDKPRGVNQGFYLINSLKYA